MEIFELHKNDNKFSQLLKSSVGNVNILYAQGSIELLNKPSIAIVGSRGCTNYGKKFSEELSRELSKMGITVVSGLATGIDEYAHIGSMEKLGRTIAVMGSGFKYIYPKRNEKLYNQIIENKGLIVTEYAYDIGPFPQNFIKRNNVIAGLSLATIVIEAREKSGALYTANMTKKQGKKLFIVPSNVDNYFAKGSNELIKEGNKIITSIEDVIEEFKYLNLRKPEPENLINAEYKPFYDILIENPLHIDEICRKLKLDISHVNSLLIKLELEGYIEQLSGNFIKWRK